MRRAVSLSGAVFALLCLAMVLFALPAGAQDGDDGIPSDTPVTPSRFIDDNETRPQVFTVQSKNCTVLETGTVAVTLQDGDGTQFRYRNGERVEIAGVGNGRVRLESRDDKAITNLGTPVSATDTDFDPVSTITAVGSTGITGCSDGDDDEDTSAPQGQYGGEGEVDIEEDVIVGTTSKKKIPNTGGPPLLLFGALLLGAAVIAGRVVLRP